MLNIEKRKKHITLLLCLAVVLVIGVGGVVAFLVTNTGTIDNMFYPAEVKCQVEEKNIGDTKSEVKIKNTGNITAYIRAKVVITWQDIEGNIFSAIPGENVDYEIEYDKDGKWILGSDGYYYHKKPIEAGASTEALIDSCTTKVACEQDGYYLNVEIMASAIQADGSTSNGVKAVVDAWGEQ